jgi:hypothetical protein
MSDFEGIQRVGSLLARQDMPGFRGMCIAALIAGESLLPNGREYDVIGRLHWGDFLPGEWLKSGHLGQNYGPYAAVYGRKHTASYSSACGPHP